MSLALSKAPWLQLVDGNVARLRFETRIAEALEVTLTASTGEATYTPELTTRDLTFERNFFEGDPEFFSDEAGAHTIQEVRLDALEPGEAYGYIIHADEPVEGSFVAPPPVGAASRIAWLSDTSWPFSRESIALVEAHAPDLLLHGGDLQYQTSPLDTWNGFAQSLANVTSRAFSHLCVGNHEFEDGDEIDQMYDRLYAGQGEGVAAKRYFALTFGGVRWICLDTETGDLATDTDQLTWLEAELAAASSSGDILHTVVCFHRPVYTLSKHFPSNTATRDALHPLFVQHGVKLVMQGHAHCYERFVVDEINYVVDGGGGALLYDPNEDREAADAMRPGESDLRVAVSESYGATLFDVAEDGTIAVVRQDVDGNDTDAFTIEL